MTNINIFLITVTLKNLIDESDLQRTLDLRKSYKELIIKNYSLKM